MSAGAVGLHLDASVGYAAPTLGSVSIQVASWMSSGVR